MDDNDQLRDLVQGLERRLKEARSGVADRDSKARERADREAWQSELERKLRAEHHAALKKQQEEWAVQVEGERKALEAERAKFSEQRPVWDLLQIDRRNDAHMTEIQPELAEALCHMRLERPVRGTLRLWLSKPRTVAQKDR